MVTTNALTNISAEKGLLACIVKNPKGLMKLPCSLKRKDFSDEDNAHIYTKLIEFLDEETVDIVALKANLAESSITKLERIIELKVNPDRILDYFEKIRDASVRRSFLLLSKKMMREVQSPQVEVSQLIHSIEKNVYDAVQRQHNPVVSASAFSDKILHRVLNRVEGEFDGSMMTGFSKLDYLTHGLQKGQMWLIGGSTSDGKTELALQILNHVCIQQGNPSVLFSHEMTKEEILERLLCLNSGVPNYNMKKGNLTQTEIQNLKEAANKISRSSLYIDDSVDLTYADIYSRIRWLKLVDPNLSLVIDDYLQLCMGEKEGNREQEIAGIGRAFKRAAKKFDVAFIALSQLNVEPDTRNPEQPPRLSDLRESKAPGHDSHVVLLIHLPFKYLKDKNFDKTVVHLFCSKNRGGDTGMIRMRNDLSVQKFVEIS